MGRALKAAYMTSPSIAGAAALLRTRVRAEARRIFIVDTRGDVGVRGDPGMSGEVGTREDPGVRGVGRSVDSGMLGVGGGLEMSNLLRYE